MGNGPRYGFYYAFAGMVIVPAGAFAPDLFRLTLTQKATCVTISIVLALLFLIVGTIKEYMAETKGSITEGHSRRMIAIGGMLICGIGFLGFAVAYFWPVREVGSAGAATPSAVRGPTLEALDHSTIDARNATIPGDLPFQFGRATGHSIIAMPGATITKTSDGYTVSPGAVSLEFPPATGEFSTLSNHEFNQKSQILAEGLRNYQHRRDVAWQQTKQKYGGSGNVTSELFKEFSTPFTEEYENNFADRAISITSEYVKRINKPLNFPNRQTQDGAQAIYYRSMAGPQPAAWAADFLDYLRSLLPEG